ncbi:MAG: sensor domain-containing protein [Acidiferrobacterales bacterium]
MKFALSIVLIAILGFIALFAGDGVARKDIKRQSVLALDYAALGVDSQPGISLRSPVLGAETPATFIPARPKLLSFAEFDYLGRVLMQQEPAIGELDYIYSRTSMRHFQPKAGIETDIGTNLMHRSAARFELRAMTGCRVVMGDPVMMARGSQSAVVCTWLYDSNHSFGLGKSVADRAPLVSAAAAGRDPTAGFQFIAAGARFFGKPTLIALVRTYSFPAAGSQRIIMAGGKVAEPGPYQFVITLMWVVGGALIVAFLFMLTRAYTRQKSFAKTALKKTQALSGETDLLGREIAEHRLTEVALREREESLSALTENANDGILVAVNEQHVFVNRRLETMLGYDAKELLGSTTRDVVHPEEYDGVIVRSRLRENGGVVPTLYETVFRTKSGARVPVEITAAATTWHGKRAVLVIVRDITERRHAEQALRESEERFRRLSEATSEGIFFIEEGRVVEANPRGAEILGLTLQDLIGRHVRDFSDPDSWPLIEKHMKSGYDKSYTAFGLRANGTRFPVELRGQVSTYRGRALRVTVMRDMTQQFETQEALRLSEERFSKVYHSSSAIISISRFKDGMFLDVNEAFLRSTGWTRAEVIGRTATDLKLWPEERTRTRLIERLESDRAVRDVDLEFRDKTGNMRYAIGSVEPMSIDGEECLLTIAQNITDRKFAEMEMQKLSRALEQTADSVMISDRNGIIEYVNLSFESVTGWTRAEAVGKMPSIVKSGKQRESFYKKLWTTILAGQVFSEVFVNKKKNGSLYYEEKTITPLKDAEGTITHFVATGKDITERMQTQERLHFLAHHDALTELPNRIFYMDRLRQSLARARWHSRRLAVLFLDLDRFKNINDTLGHAVGDRLLQLIARRFADSIREGDVVARLGGDEFAILLDDISAEKDVPAIAKKILSTLEPAFLIDQRELFVSASIGISLYPADGEDSDTLLKHADVAMYRAKDAGKNNYQFYSAEMSARAFERLTLESSLRHALERQEFLLYYQPQIDTDSGLIIGVEALLRWQHPDLGLISPAEFVPLLEETGMIVPVGQWVLRVACEQISQWHRAGHGHLRVAINLSARQFNEPDLVAFIDRTLQGAGCDPAQVELEITESVIMRHTQSTINALEALNRMGVRLAVDDFGTGYSSLSYLRRFPIDTLKIDRSFISDIQSDVDDAAITSAIIGMAQRLNIDVVAEGVETMEQLAFLRSNGCRVVQGYLFSKPLPANEIEKLFAERGI